MTEYIIQKTSKQLDYELLDSGNEEKLERYGEVILSRPDPQALWKEIEGALAAGAGISDSSLEGIGRFLGAKPGAYVPRTYYLDELNPNANLVAARVVRTCRFQDAQGAAGYTVTVQDAEKDALTFTVRGAAAREIAGAYYEVIPDTGHALHHSETARVIAAIDVVAEKARADEMRRIAAQ